MKTPIDYELIITIVKSGYSDYVVSAGRAAGATGATILNANGTESKNVEEFLGLTIQPKKEVVLIVAKRAAKKKIMREIIKSISIKKEGGGICFSMPITNITGLPVF